MGTVSVKMPDEEIERLEEMADKEGKTKSSFMREIAEREIGRGSPSTLRGIVGLWSEETAEEVEEEIKGVRKREEEEFKKSIMEKWKA